MQKNQHFLSKIVPLLKAIIRKLCWRFFISVFSFCKIKGYYQWKCHSCHKRSQFADMTLSSILKRCHVSLTKFSYWSKFHGKIITLSRVMTVFLYKGLTWNPEIRKTLVWGLPNVKGSQNQLYWSCFCMK